VPRVKAAEREAKETNRLYAELERRMPPSDLAGFTATGAGFLRRVRISALEAIAMLGPRLQAGLYMFIYIYIYLYIYIYIYTYIYIYIYIYTQHLLHLWLK